jgi:hypothetical protein
MDERADVSEKKANKEKVQKKTQEKRNLITLVRDM